MREKGQLNSFHELQNNPELTGNVVFQIYNPVISDNTVTLSVTNRVTVSEINDRSFECFDIILNETGESIGCINFDYYNSNSEYGNVSYFIDEKFQHHGYATRALKLLVNLLKNNNFKGDKDLYFWVSYYNEYSKKVILNNDGEIISGGEPESKTPYMLRIKI